MRGANEEGRDEEVDGGERDRKNGVSWKDVKQRQRRAHKKIKQTEETVRE